MSAPNQAAPYLCGPLTDLGVAFSGGLGGIVITAARMEPDRTESFQR